ncbi:MAG: alpha/beta hydrolase family esterase, partial [Geminicoccaceae bacterium]
NMIYRIALSFALLASVTFAHADEGKARIFVHEGLERVLWVVDDRADITRTAPLILALHGYREPEQAEELRRKPKKLGWQRLEALARKEGIIAVFPAAYRGQWSLVPGLEKSKRDDGTDIDDASFLLDVVADYVRTDGADPRRIYVTGISDGAIMAHRLVCLRETPFAAAAALIGTAHEDHISNCDPEEPPAIMQVHGDNDRVLPYEGWIFETGREVSVAEVMDHWRRLHGCTGQRGERLDDVDPNDGSTVVRFDWTGCKTEPNVRLFKIKGGGHDVPALDAQQREASKQKINRDLDTIGEVWRFFSAAERAEQ